MSSLLRSPARTPGEKDAQHEHLWWKLAVALDEEEERGMSLGDATGGTQVGL